MKEKKDNSNKPDFQNGKPARRRTALLPDGAYFFEDELRSESIIAAPIITCAAWLLEIFELKSGEIFLMSGDDEVRPNAKHFGILYPPFSVARICFKNVKGRLRGIASIKALPEKFSDVPAVFETTCADSPASAASAIDIVNSGDNFRQAEAYPKASLLSVKAKKLIDENYLAYPSIARIAARLGVSHAHLSRQFKDDFEMTPSAYFRRLRMADAPLLLAKGETIVDVSQEVGYNDLSRFYKQFRQTTNTSPGVCQNVMKPNRAGQN